MGALFPRGEPLSSINLSHDDVIVTLYSHIRAELTQIDDFYKQLADLSRVRASHAPERPHITILGGILRDSPQPPTGWLVPDDAHALMNTRGETYSAIHEVWGLFNTCLVDVGWPDRAVLDEEPPAAASLAGTPSDIARPYGSGVTRKVNDHRPAGRTWSWTRTSSSLTFSK